MFCSVFDKFLIFLRTNIRDDHDYGVNDAGEDVPFKDIRKKLFLDFLGVNDNDSERRINRKGVYNSITYNYSDSEKVKFILLDTRFSRSDYAIPSIGAFKAGTLFGKFMPFLASITRSISALTGYVSLFLIIGLINMK